MASILSELYKRQATFNDNGDVVNGDDGYDDGDWHYSNRAEIAKYVVVGVILLILVVWLAVGSWHANRRVRNGQQPLFYHRWLVSSRYRYQENPYYYAHDPRMGPPPYQMPVFPPGHHMYAPNGPPPQYQAPAYPPPPGASKVNPDQTVGVVEVSRENGDSSSSGASNLQQPAPTQAASPSRR